MSENKVELKELPHQFMLRKYKLTTDVLSADGKQMLKDLDKTLRLVSTNAAKKGGYIKTKLDKNGEEELIKLDD